MDKLKRGDGDQYLHRKDEKYREKVRAKLGRPISDALTLILFPGFDRNRLATFS